MSDRGATAVKSEPLSMISEYPEASPVRCRGATGKNKLLVSSMIVLLSIMMRGALAESWEDASIVANRPSLLAVTVIPEPGTMAFMTLFSNNWTCPGSGRTVRIGD